MLSEVILLLAGRDLASCKWLTLIFHPFCLFALLFFFFSLTHAHSLLELFHLYLSVQHLPILFICYFFHIACSFFLQIVFIITCSDGISFPSHLLLSIYHLSFFLSQSQFCSSGISYPRWLLESSHSVAYREKEAAVHLPASGIHSAELFVKQQITWLQLLSGTAVNSVLRVRNMIQTHLCSKDDTLRLE